MTKYLAADWQNFLSSHNLDTFDGLWDRDLDWFEEPNYGRSKNGWSGVCRIKVDGRVMYLKKQEDFYSYSLRHPLGITVAQKEFDSIQYFNSLDVPCMKVLYFGVRKCKGKLQAMLMTEGLEGYLPFSEVTQIWIKEKFGLSHRRELLKHMADFLKDAHQKGVMHFSLYSKHIYIDEQFARGGKASDQPVCRFIDMEKACKAKLHSKKQLRDLETLDRRTPYWSKADRLAFVLYYLGKKVVDKDVRNFLGRLKAISKK